MISRKHLTYIKNRLRRGGKPDKILPFLSPGFKSFKASIRDIIRGLRLYKHIPLYAVSYEGMVTRRLNNIAFRHLIECIKWSDTSERAKAFLNYHKALSETYMD